MNIKGHIAVTSIFLIEIDRIINKKEDFEIDKYINSYVNLYNLLPTFNLNIGDNLFYIFYNIIFISLLIFLGSSFPDTDTWWRKKLGLWKDDNKNLNLSNEEQYKLRFQFAVYHRQITHSLLLHSLLLFYCIYFLGFNYKNYDLLLSLFFVKILFYFEIGVFTHLIADVFVGSGGIPVLLKAHWKNKKARLSLKLSSNNSIVDITFISIYFLLLFCYILFFDNNYYTLLPIVIFSIICFFFSSSYKLFWTLFFIAIFNYIILFKFYRYIKYIF